MLLRMALGTCRILQKLCIFGRSDMVATTFLESPNNIGHMYSGHASYSIWNHFIPILNILSQVFYWHAYLPLKKSTKMTGKYNRDLAFYLIKQVYRELETEPSNLVQTAWALMGLIHSGQVNSLLLLVKA